VPCMSDFKVKNSQSNRTLIAIKLDSRTDVDAEK
jgi:hypothetical protein